MKQGQQQSSENTFQSKQTYEKYTSQSKQPIVDSFNLIMVVLAISFKIIAIIIYVTMRLCTDLFLLPFMLVFLLTVIDFWITKNLTGKKMVGLYWFNQIKQNSNQWIYDSCGANRTLSPVNVLIFWGSIIGYLIFWLVCTVIQMIFFDIFWILLTCCCGGLTLLNVVSFFKCKGQHRSKLKRITLKIGLKMFKSQEQIDKVKNIQQQSNNNN